LSINESTSLVVNADGSSEDYYANGSLVYGSGSGTEIVYSSGAVIRNDGPDAQIVSREPMFRCTDDHAVISLVSIEGPESSVSSDGSIQIKADGPSSTESTLEYAASGGGPYDVRVAYLDTPYRAAWNDHFEDKDKWTTAVGGMATCHDVDAVYVRKMTIELEYQGI